MSPVSAHKALHRSYRWKWDITTTAIIIVVVVFVVVVVVMGPLRNVG